jgi:hypothetical protein
VSNCAQSTTDRVSRSAQGEARAAQGKGLVYIGKLRIVILFHGPDKTRSGYNARLSVSIIGIQMALSSTARRVVTVYRR